MRSRCCWPAASLLALLAGAAPGPAATVLEKTIDVEIRPDAVVERHHLRVRLDGDNDLAGWSPYPIGLDENAEMVDLAASATRPDGKTLTVPKRDLDTHQLAGEGNLHSSLVVRSVTFPTVPVGSVLALDYTTRERPYFPAGQIALGSSSPTESLRVNIHGAVAGWRYRIEGALPGLSAQEAPGGVTVTGRSLPGLAPPEKSPGIAADGAVLRYAWGDSAGWDSVGRWMEGLIGQVPRGSEAVRGKARALTSGLADRRARLEALAAFARRQVRYVAVEVGIGGFRPHPPQQVMERLWGDCKDKALLLVELLKEAGIEAYPALIRFDPEARVDREFPSPFWFNHMIVAVPADGLGLGADAPVSGGYLFVDATQEIGGIDWLQPGVQDQEALVVRGGRGELVRTPVRYAAEGRRLAVDLRLGPEGDSDGAAVLELTGEPGALFTRMHDAAKPQDVDRVIRQVFNVYLPAGASLSDIRWQSMDGGVPTVKVEAKVHIPSLGAPSEAGALPVIPMPSRTDMPSSGLLDGRTVPVVDDPFASRLSWKVTLPKEACKAEGQDVDVRNGLGAFHQTVKVAGKALSIEREVELRQRWIDPAAFPALKEIALAESRANKRRLRLVCG